MVDSLRTTRVNVVREPVLTPDRILDAVSEQLERSGIAGLRLRDVAERLNVSVPSLYRFFEDREAMIAAAYVRDFSLQTFADLDELQEALGGAETREQFEDGLRRTVLDVAGDEHRRTRWRKLAAISAIRHDPELLERLASVQEQFTSRVAELFEGARSRGWIAATVNPVALAYAVQGLAMGPLFADVAATSPLSSEDLSDVVVLFHRALSA